MLMYTWSIVIHHQCCCRRQHEEHMEVEIPLYINIIFFLLSHSLIYSKAHEWKRSECRHMTSIAKIMQFNDYFHYS